MNRCICILHAALAIAFAWTLQWNTYIDLIYNYMYFICMRARAMHMHMQSRRDSQHMHVHVYTCTSLMHAQQH